MDESRVLCEYMANIKVYEPTINNIFGLIKFHMGRMFKYYDDLVYPNLYIYSTVITKGQLETSFKDYVVDEVYLYLIGEYFNKGFLKVNEGKTYFCEPDLEINPEQKFLEVQIAMSLGNIVVC